ncbi:hypothetical protein IL306_009932, partial [Fusarium sp. DS 682]
RPPRRGQPRKYATAKDKETAAAQRRRNKRQKAAARNRGVPYSNFHNLHYPIQQLDNSQSSAFTPLQEQDISNFLPPPSPPLQPTTEDAFSDHDEPLRSTSIISSSGVPEAYNMERSLPLPRFVLTAEDGFIPATGKNDNNQDGTVQPMDKQLKRLEKLVGTFGSVNRWQKENPELVGTEEDHVRILIGKVREAMEESGEPIGLSTLAAKMAVALILVKRK